MAVELEVIVKVLAEGGSVTLWGARTDTGWKFYRAVNDQTPELIDEPGIRHDSSWVESWSEAVALLDRYPWHRLHPQEVHPEFRTAVLETVEALYAGGGSGPNSRLSNWKERCSENAR